MCVIFVGFSWCDTLVHDKNWRTFCFPRKILLWKQRPFCAPWVIREDPFCEKGGPSDHIIFQEGPLCESRGQLDHLQFPQKSPPKKYKGPLGEPPFSIKALLCEDGDPLDDLCFPWRSLLWKWRPIGQLRFSKKVLSVRTWRPIPTSRGLSNNEGKKAQKCANSVPSNTHHEWLWHS